MSDFQIALLRELDAAATKNENRGWTISTESHLNGDFGNLERHYYESDKFGVTVDCWTNGTISYEAVDLFSGEFLLGPTLLFESEITSIEMVLSPLLQFIEDHPCF